MPRLFFVKPKTKINGGMDSITPIDCVPRVFDPGTSISLGMLNKLFKELLQPNVKATTGLDETKVKEILGAQSGTNSGVKEPSTLGIGGVEVAHHCHEFDMLLGKQDVELQVGKMLFTFDPGGGYWLDNDCDVSASIATEIHETDIDLCVGKVLLLTFDPGGNSLYHKDCSSLKPNGVVQNFKFRLNESNSARVEQCHQNDLVYMAFEEVEFTSLNAGVWLILKDRGLIPLRHKLSIFDPGGSTSHHVECNAFKVKHDNEIVSNWKAISCNSQIELFSLGVVVVMVEDGHYIILLGKAPKLKDFILGKGQDIHELPVFIWVPGPFLVSTHPWGQGCLQEGRKGNVMHRGMMVCIDVRIDCRWNPKNVIYPAMGCIGRRMKYTAMTSTVKSHFLRISRSLSEFCREMKLRASPITWKWYQEAGAILRDATAYYRI